MSDIIHLLPDHIANQIAAGEVIQRPASVVKELMENSVDAGAKKISVIIRDAGRTLIQVADDGKGMSETDARMAFERHATSKIASVDDLFSLQSMGFRGEALASIAAVAQVELRTKTKGDDIGTSLSIAGSALLSVSPEVCNEGSVFSVKNLFYNVPARRRFLKTNETEFRHILSEFERVALVHPHIYFTLRHNEIAILELPASGIKQRIIALFGKAMNEKLFSVEAKTSLVHVSGFTGRPDTVKKHGHQQFFFVNGRFMRHPYFHKAVLQAYERMIPAGEMPDYFICFTLDPSSIDVNIHPTKTEIKFENEKPIWHIINSAVRETLVKSNAIPSIDFDAASAIDLPLFNPSHTKNTSPAVAVDEMFNPFKQSTGAVDESFDPFNQPTDWKSLYEGFENDRAAATRHNDDAAAVSTTPYYESELPLQKAYNDSNNVIARALARDNPEPENALFTEFSHLCFQYKNRYIITPLKSGLVIIDQHRAHVRILYERYIGNIHNRRSVSQKLLFPETVEFATDELLALAALHDEICYLGFELVFISGNSYAIHATPVEIASGNPAAQLKNIIAATIENGASEKDILTEKIALSLARATAIPVGKTLTTDEMDSLVASLFAIEANGLTPDGQPILTVLTDEELSKRM